MATKLTKSNLRQSKTILAKLLAHENIHVTFSDDAPTASFDLNSRTLELPMLQNMEDFHYDGLISHEIGHALYTPADETHLNQYLEKVPFDFINITEDARIEKLVQNKYPGLKRDFYDMYKDFSAPERDMFKIEGKDLSTLPTIDKINLFFKIGKFTTVPFRNEEAVFVKKVADIKTFDDAAKVAQEIYEFMKQDNQIPQDHDPKQQNQKQSGQGSGSGKGSGKKGKKSDQDSDSGGDSGSCEDGSAGFTQREFEKARKKLIEANQSKDGTTGYGEMPNPAGADPSSYIDNSVFTRLRRGSKNSNVAFEEFRSYIRPIVNMMVAEFNMRKAARDWQRTKISDSGKLNMKKVSRFGISDNVFKSYEEVKEEKNHGFVFLIDWSGSMGGYIHSTVCQMIINFEFCRRLSIPFEGYAFTNSSYSGGSTNKDKVFVQSNDSARGNVFKLIDSTVTAAEYSKIIEKLYVDTLSGRTGDVHSMNGTPLYNAAMVMDLVMHNFAKKYKREKNILVLLSDGEAGDGLMVNGKANYDRMVINDVATAQNYHINSFHDVFRIVKDRQSVYKMIGFYITSHKISYEVVYPEFSSKGMSDKKHDEEFDTKNYTVLEDGVAFDKFFVINMNEFKIVPEKSSDVENSEDAEKNVELEREKFAHKVKNMIFNKIMVDTIS